MKKLKVTPLYCLLALAFLVNSCTKRERSLEFMPDMYYPTAYDPYQESVINARPSLNEKESEVKVFQNQGGMTALTPVKGTVPREGENILPYDLLDTPEGYEASKLRLETPLKPENAAQDQARGKILYTQNCAICHGDAGDGMGPIKASGKYNGPVPNYKDREITVGSVYHVIMYGKNVMGSYASQLQPEDRWKVAQYVMELKNN
ncbi:MAG: cytochrome C [Flavobacteriaceae bacterium]|nr:MAG: cytochrome C [Flavobacteriaceae bacterium]